MLEKPEDYIYENNRHVNTEEVFVCIKSETVVIQTPFESLTVNRDTDALEVWNDPDPEVIIAEAERALKESHRNPEPHRYYPHGS